MTHLDDGTLQAFLDDELAPTDRASVAEHLLGCEWCQSAHEALTRASALFTQSASVLDVEPAAGVKASAVGQHHAAGQRRRRARTPAAIKAALLVLAVAAAASAAVPGSPVHEWVARAVGAPDAPADDPSVGPNERFGPAEPAPTGTVEGVIRGGGDGERLPYARVEVVGDTVADWTDEGGAYRLDGLRRGVHRIQVVHPGHDTLGAVATIVDGRPVRIDLTLQTGPRPEVDALADFEPIRVEFTLPALLNAGEVAGILRRMYPSEMAEATVGGEAVLRLWLDETGQVVRSAVSSSSGDGALDSLALIVADSMRFRPARREQDGVRVIVQIPLVFLAPAPAAGSLPRPGQRR